MYTRFHKQFGLTFANNQREIDREIERIFKVGWKFVLQKLNIIIREGVQNCLWNLIFKDRTQRVYMPNFTFKKY